MRFYRSKLDGVLRYSETPGQSGWGWHLPDASGLRRAQQQGVPLSPAEEAVAAGQAQPAGWRYPTPQ